MTESRRLAVLNTHPIQYFAPLYAYLNQAPDLDVTALYCSNSSLRGGKDPGFGQSVTWDVDLLDGYRARFLGRRYRKRTPGGFWSLICPEVWGEIRRGNYDALIVHGYSYAVVPIAVLAAKASGTKVFMKSETHLGLTRSEWKQKVRDGVLGVLYRGLDGALAIGTENRRYYRHLGVPEEKIFLVPYAVDNERFMTVSRLSPERRRELRASFGVSDDATMVLFASKFTSRKHPDQVIRAVAMLGGDAGKVELVMVGAGVLEGELRALVAELDMPNVTFVGFINQSELPEVFGAADVFVLPSDEEPWGLIVNEVMCAGVPVVTTRAVGCVPDLIEDGVTGMLIEPGDTEGLAAKLTVLAKDPTLRRDIGRAGLNRIRGWDYRRCAEGIRAALSA